MIDLASRSTLDVLRLHNSVEDELRARGLTRSGNNPLCDLAENLFCRTFSWDQAPPSEPGADAVCKDGIRYQIKSRRLRIESSSRQVGALRNLELEPFDFLAGVLFKRDYAVYRAALIPISVVKARSGFQKHTNSAIFHLSDSLWAVEGVVDVTEKVGTAWVNWDDL